MKKIVLAALAAASLTSISSAAHAWGECPQWSWSGGWEGCQPVGTFRTEMHIAERWVNSEEKALRHSGWANSTMWNAIVGGFESLFGDSSSLWYNGDHGYYAGRNFYSKLEACGIFNDYSRWEHEPIYTAKDHCVANNRW